MYVIKLPFVTVRELGIDHILQISGKSLERTILVLQKFEIIKVHSKHPVTFCALFEVDWQTSDKKISNCQFDRSF